ncbi:MAG TPA: hypothetical protein VK629_01075 [Steroidobacteraceae bacterium]|nr:hypothetical protein [Steroidobacteraceae bacterium]
MPKFLKSLLYPDDLRSDAYVFTLDHDGGLVVSLDALMESKALDMQLEGVRILDDIEKKKAHSTVQPAAPKQAA